MDGGREFAAYILLSPDEFLPERYFKPAKTMFGLLCEQGEALIWSDPMERRLVRPTKRLGYSDNEPTNVRLKLAAGSEQLGVGGDRRDIEFNRFRFGIGLLVVGQHLLDELLERLR